MSRCPCVGSVRLDWRPFGLAFSSPFSQESRVAVTSFEMGKQNFVKFFRMVGPSILAEGECETKFPQTCVLFSPSGGEGASDVAVTCGDSLKVWRASLNGATAVTDISVNETSDPITCADWSLYEDSIVLTGSTDATATAIDLTRGQIAAKIIAHDHPLHDICFCGASSTFVTAGFDGSLRFFDLRDLQTSYIWYQTAMPLMRVAVSPLDTSRVVVFAKGSRSVVVIDSRHPGVPEATIDGHNGAVTCLGWSKLRSDSVYTADDRGGLFLAGLSGTGAEVSTSLCWESGGDAIESFAVGQGVIAVATGTRVDLLENPWIVQSSLGPPFLPLGR